MVMVVVRVGVEGVVKDVLIVEVMYMHLNLKYTKSGYGPEDGRQVAKEESPTIKDMGFHAKKHDDCSR